MSMIQSMINQGVSHLLDPFRNFNFIVEIDGILAAGYSEVNGMGIELDVEKRHFGGENDVQYTFLKSANYSHLVLKNGISQYNFMWQWFEDTVQGKPKARNGSIFLYDLGSKTFTYWNFYQAYPIKWEGPSLNAQGNEVATHTLTLAYQQLKKGTI